MKNKKSDKQLTAGPRGRPKQVCVNLVALVVSDSLQPYGLQPSGLLLPKGFPRQEYWKSSEVAQSCPTPFDSMGCSLPGSSAHGILKARVLEWVAIPSPGDFLTQGSNPHLLHWQAGSLPLSHLRSPCQGIKAMKNTTKNVRVGSHKK